MMTNASMTLAGIDIGGTKIGVCLGDDIGHVVDARRFAIDHEASPEDVLDRALGLLDEMMAEQRLEAPRAIGVPCPGPIDVTREAFLDPPNMPRWHDFEVMKFLRARRGPAVHMMNDANATALAEWRWGAAKGTRTAAFLTMSTGMGAGLIIDGQLFEGKLGLAGEIGHIRMRGDGPVGFGKRGSVEGYLSGPGMVQVAEAERRVAAQRGETTQLAAVDITPERLFEAARAGDAVAIRAVDRIGHMLGELIAMLTDLLNPEAIVLGTIGTAAFDLLEPRARAVVEREALPAAAALLRILPTGLKDKSSQAALAVATLAIESSDV